MPLMRLCRFLLCFFAVHLLACPISLAQETGLYVKKDTWQATMHASRESFLTRHGAPEVELGPWYATAPLKAKEFTLSLFPEKGVALASKDANGAPQWKKHAEWKDGIVHSLPLLDQASTYLFRTVTVKDALELSASLGSDDGIEVWLNREKILSHDVPRGVAPDQERVTLSLKAGENRLLLKIHNNAGGHGFYFALKNDPLLRLWERMEEDFPLETGWMKNDLPGRAHLDWFNSADSVDSDMKMIESVLDDLKRAGGTFREELSKLAGAGSNDPRLLVLYMSACRVRKGMADLEMIDVVALRLAIEDLRRTYPGSYDTDGLFRDRLEEFERPVAEMKKSLDQGVCEPAEAIIELTQGFEQFRREAMLANPLLDFDRVLLVKRKASGPRLGLPQNWQGNCSLPRTGYEDEIATLSMKELQDPLTTFCKPSKPSFVGDVDLDFDAGRMLFSMIGSHNRWQIWEIKADGTGLRQVTSGMHTDVDNYDACYLPDSRIVFDSSRCFQGIPCVGGADSVANLCIMDSSGNNIRQLCFDQDHDWCPTVLNNGRVLYTRWEYSDTPHYFSRLLFHMNPDGTGQMEYYGSNSFWPNSIFYARPIPGHPTRVVAVISGHHGVPRMGELVLLDPVCGRFEADGAIQRIPGRGEKVEPLIVDQLVNASWPKFLHPFPLSEKYFLVSCKPDPDSEWGIFLVDVFDNMLCLKEEPGYALFEPIPFVARPKPPSLPDRINPDLDDAIVYLEDIYKGEGLAGLPRGIVKKLRLYEFHYCYPQMGGHKHVGVESAWDVHRILGTVPVYSDGSASFKVPANMPIAVQPLDESGAALQVMRSWFAAMPGEVLSCVGCHEPQNAGPAGKRTVASRMPPSAIEPWYGPARGFSFKRDIQPVLDRHCIGCHDGKPRPDKKTIPDLTAKPENGWGNFTPSYLELHPFVRRPGPESDYHLQKPMEFYVNTSELVQMLGKGHHNVALDQEAWDRLYTWIDLNVPDHGTWSEHRAINADFHERRMKMRTLYAGRPEDPEAIPELSSEEVCFSMPEPVSAEERTEPGCPGWPFDTHEACRKQKESGLPTERDIALGNGVIMKFVLIPSGAFVMGDPERCPDEKPRKTVRIEKPFYMSRYEVTLEQFRCFDPEHKNGYLDQQHKDHTTPGYPVDFPGKPVIRVSWNEAAAFCDWLAEKAGCECSMPTEAQWEWACRAGADTHFSYGTSDTDFSKYANLADLSIKRLAVTGVNPQPIKNPNKYQDFVPKDSRFDDGERLMADAGQYLPNAWGLHDMHGNVCEWTISDFEEPGKVVRGGSWRDRPKRARSGFRLAYPTYQPVFNVGIRVVVKALPESKPGHDHKRK